MAGVEKHTCIDRDVSVPVRQTRLATRRRRFLMAGAVTVATARDDDPEPFPGLSKIYLFVMTIIALKAWRDGIIVWDTDQSRHRRLAVAPWNE